MSGITIIDDALCADSFNDLQALLLGSDFPWYFSNSKVTNKESKDLHDFQFAHVFFRDNEKNSSYINKLGPLLDVLKARVLIRVKANLTTCAKKKLVFDMHTDIPYLDKQNYKTAIFYLNNTNGKTVFATGEEVECVANRLVIFNGNIAHSGSTHTDAKVRAVINFNYFVDDVDYK